MRATMLMVAAALALTAGPAVADDDVEEVAECMEQNLPGRSSIEVIRLVKTDRTGAQEVLEAKHYWKRDKRGRSKNLIEIEAPADVRGTAYLVIQHDDREDIFSYLPEIGRPRRVQASAMNGSLFGTDFTFEDIRYLQDSAHRANTQRLEDAQLDGREVYVLESEPEAEEQSEYERVRSSIDKETCIPLRIDYHGSGGAGVVKSLSADPTTLVRTGKGWIAKSYTLNNLKSETKTDLQIQEVEIDPAIRDRMFTVSYLERQN